MNPTPQYDPRDQALRARAAARVARKRAFYASALLLGSLIVLNLFFYASTRNSVWLLLDGVFAAVLAFRARQAFAPPSADEAAIRREVDRMRRK